MRDIVSAFDWSVAEIERALELGRKFYLARLGKGPWPEDEVMKACSRFSGRPKVTRFFAEPSGRTDGSYGRASELLPVQPCSLPPAEWTSMAKNESLARTVVTVAQQGAQVIVQRTPWKGSGRFGVEILYKYGYAVATHCGGDGSNQHGSQGLLDTLTIQLVLPDEVIRTGRLRLGVVGDLFYSRVLHSTIPVLAKLFPGLEVFAVSEPETRLNPRFCCGVPFHESNSMTLLKKARPHIVIVTRVQVERFHDKTQAAAIARKHRMDGELLEYLTWRAYGRDFPLVMHPQPIANNEVDSRILQHPQVIIDFQAERGIDYRMAGLIRSLQLLDQDPIVFTPSPAILEVIRRKGLTEHYRAMLKNKGQSVHPIDNGYVFDHLYPGFSEKIVMIFRAMGWLKPDFDPEHPVVPAVGLASKTMGVKDRLSIVTRKDLPPEALNLVRILCPEATVNRMDGSWATKFKVRAPRFFRGINCPDPECISSKDREYEARHPVFRSSDRGRIVQCCYCEGVFLPDIWRRHNGLERPRKRRF